MHTAQDNALREAQGTVNESRSDLPQKRQQRHTRQGIDIVDQEHDRFWRPNRPVRKHEPKRRRRLPEPVQC